MNRIEFFKMALTKFRAQCKEQGIPVSERRFLTYLQSKLPENKWKQIAPFVDRQKADIPHHKDVGYKAKRDKKIICDWIAARYTFMFGKPVCENCGGTEGPMFKDLTSIGAGFKHLWFTYCSDSCSKGSASALAKRKATSQLVYGAPNVAQSKTFRKKMKKYWGQFDEEQRLTRNRKREDTLIQKHGSVAAGAAFRAAKMVATNQLRYGGNAATCSAVVRAKVEATNLQRRGVTNPSKDPKVMQKIQESWKTRKEITLKGKTFKGLQGYEPQAIEWLVSNGVKVRDIKRPEFGVTYKLDGKHHTYHPDLIVTRSGEEIIVEIKSIYTSAIMKDTPGSHRHGTYTKVRAKINACVDLGYKVRLLVVTEQGECFTWKDKLPKNRESVKRAYLEWKDAQV